MTIHADEPAGIISRHIFGHFSEHLGRCIYDGYWVGEDSAIPNTRGIRTDIVDALKRIGTPVLRWPGGCFADDYHWEDGIGPRDRRPSMVNTHWGGVVETNHFGTHEFIDLCDQLETEPYICGNVGSGSVRELRDWVEYITGGPESPMGKLRGENGRDQPWPLTFVGIGNENWGCGGDMRPEYYADLYRRFAGYVRKSGGKGIYRIACGANRDDYRWTEVLMDRASKHFEGLSLHYYTQYPNLEGVSKSATEFDELEWFLTMKTAVELEEILDRHITIMDRYDPAQRVGLIVDEWGTWHDTEPGTNPRFLYQQNTVRDAVVAAHQLNLFAGRCNRVYMANIAQTVNVLQSMILTSGEKMILTPTYHVFDLYRAHQEAELLPVTGQRGVYEYGGDGKAAALGIGGAIPALSYLASKNGHGSIHITFANMHPHKALEISCAVRGTTESLLPSSRIVTGESMTDRNTFDTPNMVTPVEHERWNWDGNRVSGIIPERSVVSITLKTAGDEV